MKQQKHILVIDDNADLLMMLKAMLVSRGYLVTAQSNTDDIIEFTRSVTPDIILMDMLLSGADGREICKDFKADNELKKIPVIMLSAYPMAQIDCINAGADKFIEKPFDMNHLLDTIAAYDNAH